MLLYVFAGSNVRVHAHSTFRFFAHGWSNEAALRAKEVELERMTTGTISEYEVRLLVRLPEYDGDWRGDHPLFLYCSGF